MTIRNFQRKILAWYRHNRRDLPWRPHVRWSGNLPLGPKRLPRSIEPYNILVSEIMLQQTQVPRVFQKYPLFLKNFPNWDALASASTKSLFSIWQGMGYWRRALYLRECARRMQKIGILPQTPIQLQTLPGIGPYTAGAIACFAFQHYEAFVDTNVRRVYIKFFFPHIRRVTDAEILSIAQKAVWLPNPREWHYALMDYGALVLGKDRTLNTQSVHYHKQTRFEDSPRFWKSHIMRMLLAHGSLSRGEIARLVKKKAGEKGYAPPLLDPLLVPLEKNHMVRRSINGKFSLV